ncbi:MAG: Ig-like domain-containing protein [Gemmatimonadales bacterium]
MPSVSSRRGTAALEASPSLFARAWKWGAGSLSAGAALVSILSSVRSITGAEQVRWIGVAPAADTAWSLGDTLQLATTLTDAHGGVLPGVRVGWTSTDTSVAVVDSGGAVVARAPGAATVVAAAGGHIAQSRIVVRPRPAAIRIFGDSALSLPEDTALRLVARVVDARQHAIPGQSIAWRSADPSVAGVDTAARVTAVGAGHTTLVASGGDITTEVPLEVYPVPATVTVQAGDGQRASAGRRLATPVRAQIVSRGGRPLAGVAVRFGVTDTAGRVEQDVDTSDAEGLVRAAWTLGPHPGRQRLTVVVIDRPSVGTSVAADADPLPENTRATAVDAPRSAVVGEALAEPVAVRVTDTTGSPLADVLIGWSADGGGTIVGEGPRTDSLGEARARWTLGPHAGAQRAWAQVGAARAIPRVALEATAAPGAPAALTTVRAAVLRGVAGQPIVPAPDLRVTDRAGNPVPGVAVSLRPVSGSVRERSAVTDSTGRISVAWTLGPSVGQQRLTASATGVERGLELTAQVRAGPAGKVALESLPATALGGEPLPRPVEAIVTDAHGNPVAGALVTFTGKGGKVSPARARTDDAGRAAARWTLGPTAGEQRIEVAVKDAGIRASGTVRATAPARRRR